MVRSIKVWRGIFVIGAIALLVGVAVGWAVSVVAQPVADPSDSLAYTLVTVTQGQVGSSVKLNTMATWPTTVVGVNRSQGVVTGVNLAPGEVTEQGDIIYSVDLRPVIVAMGDIPAFRTITAGDSGADVSQLQSMLTALSFYSGPISGTAGKLTARAIKAWQTSLGLPNTGQVDLGDVIFVPQLPARLSLDTAIIKRGASLTGGEPVMLGLPDAPTFTIPVTDMQAAGMPPGTRVEITAPNTQTWQAVIDDQSSDPNTGFVDLSLASLVPGTICADQCDLVSVTGQTRLDSTVITMEPVSGLMVPSAAVATQADGSTVVVTDSGERLVVQVVASAKGMSIITGVNAGLAIRIPGNPHD